MLEKSRERSTLFEYEDDEIFSILEEKYEQCIRLAAYTYVVCEEGKFYLMKKEIPDIFSIDNATEIPKMTSISDGGKNNIRFGAQDLEKTYVVFISKEKALSSIERWAM